MNWKKYWLASVAILIVAKGIVTFLFFAVIFDNVYAQPFAGSRPEGEELHAVGMVGMLSWTLAFTFIYAKSAENKGWKEGIRFGLIVWVLYFIPMITGVWAYFQVTEAWVIAGLLSGLAESLTAGLLVGLIYKPLKHIR